MKNISTIKVTVDKSHLFTLGERMYRESIEFIRELVSNAYDADATEVRVNISKDQIEVVDNGSGMNEQGLVQFFTIGSEEKKSSNISPKFGRKRIGQFGIGKFSALSMADQFIVESVRGAYKHSVIFNRANWQASDSWQLPITRTKKNIFDLVGTKVILNNLTKKVSSMEVEKYLQQSVPLRAKKFGVYLNNKKITAKNITGKVIAIDIKTIYGLIEGEILIAVDSADVDEPGVECRVRQVFVKRSFFGVEKKSQQGINRITGYVNADFLDLISSRSDFIKDAPAYKLFEQLIRYELEKVMNELRKQKNAKNVQKLNRDLTEIMKQIRDALVVNPDFMPEGRAIVRLKKEGKKDLMIANSTVLSKSKKEKPKSDNSDDNESNVEKKEKEKEETPKITEKPVTIKRIQLKKFGISCGVVSLGVDAPEVLSQGNMIYINQDHPLYQSVYKNRDLFKMLLFRLITQEIVLMKKLKITARDAFQYQSKLLLDALIDK